MIQNPFTFGNPIKDPSLFCGRKQEIRQIVNRLLSSSHESTSIVGEGRMGSTSLLKYLVNPDVAQNLGLNVESFCMVYVDFQGTDLTAARFWKRILHAINRSLLNPQLAEMTKQLEACEQIDLFELEDHFERMTMAGLTIVLFMDEFENITKNPNFHSDFFGGLRAMAIHHGLALIPATRSELVDLCASSETKGSPFFNIFANVVLMPLSADEAEGMVDTYMERGGLSFTPEDQAFIMTMGGGHPYLLQIAGYHWFEARARGLEGDDLYKTASERIYEQAEPHFRDMWSLYSEAEKSLLVSLLTNTPTEKPVQIPLTRAEIPEPFLRSLLRRGLVVKTGESITLISPTFGQFLRNRMVAPTSPVMKSEPALPGQESQRHLRKYDVFISYSATDRQTTDAIMTGLEERGVHCWIAPRDILPGTPYGQAIINAINQCKGMVVVFSSNSNTSEQVMQEVERAVSKRLTIIPLRIENTLPTGSMELFLSARQWLDALEVPLEAKLDQLAETIRNLK